MLMFYFSLDLSIVSLFDITSFTFDTNCKGCNSVEYDDKLTMIILTTYNKRGDLIARTVIKPPSFVTYTKSENE